MYMGKSTAFSKPAVFLDRDGVLTEEKGYVTSKDELSIFHYAADCVKKIHDKGYYAIVITNQSGVARGLFTEEALQEMNQYLIRQTGVDAVYYCPHHPDAGCRCRKPQKGMFERACRDFAIDVEHSYMVGDRAGDIIAGQNAGVQTVLLESGYGTARLETEVKPDFVFDDLTEVIKIL